MFHVRKLVFFIVPLCADENRVKQDRVAADVFSAVFSFAMKTKTYTYIDGNNNTYTIRPDSIFYKPVTPAESSSGIYSGGEPKAVKLSAEQFAKIEAMIKAIWKDKKIHCDKREMGYGTIVIKKSSIFLSTNDKSKLQLEQELKAVVFGI